ncbi:hypothetical protein TRIUR3_19700 [Triticum urartu]|uniref:Uncharacterized protein n=1 Tax=Triticum urartu TaxID=4572 RepID=M8A7K6_TRIUA|nr:hypothetical protein TRIUR3_19700 [Triticum urartu]
MAQPPTHIRRPQMWERQVKTQMIITAKDFFKHYERAVDDRRQTFKKTWLWAGLASGMYSLMLKLKSERLVEDGVESVAERGSVRLSLLLELQRRYTEINRKVAIARTLLSLMQEDILFMPSSTAL